MTAVSTGVNLGNSSGDVDTTMANLRSQEQDMALQSMQNDVMNAELTMVTQAGNGLVNTASTAGQAAAHGAHAS